MDAERRIAVISNRLEQVDRESSGMTDYLIDLLATAGKRLTRELEELRQA